MRKSTKKKPMQEKYYLGCVDLPLPYLGSRALFSKLEDNEDFRLPAQQKVLRYRSALSQLKHFLFIQTFISLLGIHH